MVYPSGGERTARPTPIEPPAPVTFSTRMASPSVVFIRSARIRVIASDGPPAENGTTMVMGCDGKLSASALPANDISAINAAKTVLRITPLQQRPHHRHCEERSEEAIQLSVSRRCGLRRCARNDGLEFCVVDRLMTIERARDRRQRVFKPCGAIEQHHPVTFRYPAVGKALFVSGVSRRALGTQQQAFFACDFIKRSRNFLVAHRNGKTFAFPHGAQNK